MDRSTPSIRGALCIALLSAASCKAKVGDACQAGQSACVNDKSGLFCASDGKLASMTCSGGCRVSGAAVTCDNSIAEVNDGCALLGDLACTSDRKNAVECGKDGKFAVTETCKGQRGCMITGDTIECDNDTSDLNDPCRMAGDYACTSDKGMALRCRLPALPRTDWLHLRRAERSVRVRRGRQTGGGPRDQPTLARSQQVSQRQVRPGARIAARSDADPESRGVAPPEPASPEPPTHSPAAPQT